VLVLVVVGLEISVKEVVEVAPPVKTVQHLQHLPAVRPAVRPVVWPTHDPSVALLAYTRFSRQSFVAFGGEVFLKLPRDVIVPNAPSFPPVAQRRVSAKLLLIV
jgi:hypothetical protein